MPTFSAGVEKTNGHVLPMEIWKKIFTAFTSIAV